jgi:hypothetical protein
MSHDSPGVDSGALDEQLTTPLGRIRVVSCLRERPGVPPWIGEGALALTVWMVSRGREDLSASVLRASGELVNSVDPDHQGVGAGRVGAVAFTRQWPALCDDERTIAEQKLAPMTANA